MGSGRAPRPLPRRRSFARPRRGSLLALHNAHPHRLAFLQRPESGTVQHRRVDEPILAAGLRGDEAEPLVRVVPFHRAGHLDRGAEIDLTARTTTTAAA